MARAFTTSFSYNGHSYTAVISQLDGSVNIYVPDESLHGVLPAGKASFHSDKGLPIDQPRLNPVQHLLLTILTSVELPVKERSKNAEAKW